MADSNFNLDIPLGDRKIAIPMKATVKAYIDLSKFSKENVKIDGKDTNYFSQWENNDGEEFLTWISHTNKVKK